MADIDLERTDPKLSRHPMKHLFQSRLLLSLCCCVFALTLLFNFKYSSNYSIDQGSVQFNDSSQYTDYALLEQLLLQDSSTSTLPRDHLFIQKLARDSIQGHTMHQLVQYQSPSVTVTAILRSHIQLTQQLRHVLSQTIVPDHIWIIGDQKIENNERVRYVDAKDIVEAISLADADYVWVLDHDTLPGKRYLEYALKVNSSPEYNNALVGTGAYRDGQCISAIERSQVVDVVRDSWVIKKSWIPFLKREKKGKEEALSTFISRVLYTHGIPSVALPSTDLDYMAHTKPRETCKEDSSWRKKLPNDAILFYFNLPQMEELVCRFVDNNVVIVSDIEIKQCKNDSWPVFKASDDISPILNLVQPKLVISDTRLYQAEIPIIYLSKRDIPHSFWLTDLPVDILAEWNSISIKIMVNVDKKHDNYERLITSLDKAHYLGDSVDLTFLMDYAADRTIQRLANHYQWKHGRKYLRHRIVQTHRMALFAESWYPSSNDEYAILLDTELELSPHFYSWAKYAILQYRHQSKKLFGISLYRPNMIETDSGGRRLFTERPHGPFLMQWPSHSGAVFFPEHWREFHDYMTARLADRTGHRMQDVTIPESRVNEWKLSWRKYFEELVYLRSYVMLYPSTSLSTRHIELKKKSQKEKFKDALSLFEVPLMTNASQLHLPASFDLLPIYDYYGHLSDMKTMEKRGGDLQDSISACLPNTEQNFDPSDLLCPFGKIVTVTVENEDDPVPELPPKKVDVYV
ncbi:uncharacterized protein RHIMIDRAFT_264292 [Rhizopus microsporus ATCC 52813]|uniref:Nucleotide-diphospho-sugar transferase n=1 Tax=Rhizopus microsporus ATCC 52813 TaxID=1340429 RepID=A0A2G4SK95_RHIZD|nr:uncharacterized protein RHIMIDRAFT_264292 [Rhizopus microsporus ATCC 52813]PHZ09185.1 hypothetical protein RHIMIDRAFT_264292 [Rhizopus microsporus ATCC 52813]